MGTALYNGSVSSFNVHARKIVVLVDENTLQHCWPYLSSSVSQLSEAELIEVPSGESSKSIEIVAQLWSTLTELEINRNDCLVVLGGGVLCDLGGFVASTFKRGMRCVYIPTTLLAMVDAAHGGKTGIDYEGYKNIIGTFQEPESIWMDVQFLQTLPQTELESGHGEMIKHALLSGDRDLLETVTTPGFLETLSIGDIQKSLQIKLNIVAADPQEQGERKKLNLGHTIGHAIESHYLATGQPIKHGVAVIYGLVAELYLAYIMGALTKTEHDYYRSKINHWFKRIEFGESQLEDILRWMKNDKKNSDNLPSFVWVETGMKVAIERNAPWEKIAQALRECWRYS